MTTKRQLITAFQQEVLSRDSYKCKFCYRKGGVNCVIIDENLPIIKENGISLCKKHINKYKPEQLLKKINSSVELIKRRSNENVGNNENTELE